MEPRLTRGEEDQSGKFRLLTLCGLVFYLDNGSPGIWDPNKGLPRQELGDIVVPDRPGINRRHLSNHSCRLK